ncbi:hypothetical protein M758_12G162100 [Ceratodon purpureus]|nr:hypothetical protein M758_12G162100 [Ceratodon purpureus]
MSNQADVVEIPPCPRAILTSQAISRNVVIPSSITTIPRLLDTSNDHEFGPSRFVDQNVEVGRQLLETEFEVRYTYICFYEIQLQIGKTMDRFYKAFERDNRLTQDQNLEINNLLNQHEYQLQDIVNYFCNDSRDFLEDIVNRYDGIQQMNLNSQNQNQIQQTHNVLNLLQVHLQEMNHHLNDVQILIQELSNLLNVVQSCKSTLYRINSQPI